MAKPKQKTKRSLRARATQAKGRRRKKPTNRVERAFDGVRQLVSETGDRLLSRQRKAGTKRGSVKKSGSARIRGGQQRQSSAKKAGSDRIRSGQKRQAAVKNAARKRRIKTS